VREGDAAFEALREAIGDLAGDRAQALAAEAEAEAVARVRSILVDAIADSLLEEAAQRIATRGPGPDRAPAPARPPRRPSRPSRARNEAEANAPTSPAVGAAPRRQSRDDLGIYVYGITDAGSEPPSRAIPGVEPDEPVSLVEHAGLAAITSRVALADFGEEPLRENLEDVAWLEAKARAHEAVLEDMISKRTVVPFRLCTIYLGESQVREMLERERDAFRDALERLAGRTEWGVKLIAEQGALESQRPGPDPTDESPSRSRGAAYMARRGAEAREREEADDLAAEWAEAAHERLSGVAGEALRNPIPDPAVSGAEGEMLLNGVYLVADAEGDRFREAVAGLAREHAEHGLSVELTGPWPAYNFVKSSIEAAR